MATASTLNPTTASSTAAGSLPPARHRSPSPAAASLRSAAAANAAAAAARCPPNDPNLRTPLSSTYPSSLHSPKPGSMTPNPLKAPADPFKTPLTPPSAYIDFLRVLSPNPYTPSSLSTGTSTHFSYGASSPRWPSSACLSAKSLSPGPRTFQSRSFSETRSISSPRPDSAASSAALSAAAGNHAVRETVSAPPTTAPRANSGRSMTRPSDLSFASSSLPPNNVQSIPSPTGNIPRPLSARQGGPARPSLIIPPSPTSAISSMSPSQHSAPARSAYPSSAHPNSAHPSSALVPTKGRSPLSACVSASDANTSSPVTIRHIVTRTVTYRRPNGATAASATAAPKPKPGRARVSSPLSAVEGVSDDDDDDDDDVDDDDNHEREKQKKDQQRQQRQHLHQHRLIGDVPKGKRRKVE